MKKKLKKVCKKIALDLIESEGSDPEFLSISESVHDYAEENDISSEDTKEKMCQYIYALITSAIITIEFPEEDSEWDA